MTKGGDLPLNSVCMGYLLKFQFPMVRSLKVFEGHI